MTRPLPASPARRRGAAIGMALLAALTGCASVQPPRYHTLMPASALAAGRPPAPAGSLAWEVLPVAVPAGVDQPQWVVRTVDGSLAVLEQERWIGPLGEEIRAAVAQRLTQQLGAPAVSVPGEPRKRWRIRIDVQRFDSVPGREARLEATWTVRSGAEPATALRCRGEFVQTPASAGYPALAQGHRQAVATLADTIGAELKALGAGQPADCTAAAAAPS